jgi:hypothetical protein
MKVSDDEQPPRRLIVADDVIECEGRRCTVATYLKNHGPPRRNALHKLAVAIATGWVKVTPATDGPRAA